MQASSSAAALRAANPNANPNAHPNGTARSAPPAHLLRIAQRWTPDQVAAMIQRYNELNASLSNTTSREYAQLHAALATLQHLPTPTPTPTPTPPMDPTQPSSEPSMSSLRVLPGQMHLLQAHLDAYRTLSHNQPVPDRIQPALSDPSAYFASIHRPDPLLALDLLPPHAQSDVLLTLEQRERFIQARINQRIAQLESLPATLPTAIPTASASSNGKHRTSEAPSWLVPGGIQAAETNPKLDALIELRSLQLLPQQRAFRQSVVQHGTSPVLSQPPPNRAALRKVKKGSLRQVRLTEALERKQRDDTRAKAVQQHTQDLLAAMEQSSELHLAHRTCREQTARLARNLGWFHADAEREEAKRIERVAKERLNALRADDEEAYLKLIDTAKDTRIAHLLGQTDKYLDNLALAVQEQQSSDPFHPTGPTGPADEVDESVFGATRQENEDDEGDKSKANYYSIAHRIRETVSEQPKILVGGELKDYQLKGLQWMVSLYNNKLNGILADEMGLGKTIQTISLITYLIEKKKQSAPYLVIVPLSTLQNWVNEFSKWAPSVGLLVYKGQPQQRRELAARVRAGNWQVLLTTYEFIIKDKNVLGKQKWVHMIIDEGHRMKNAASKLSVTLTQFYASRYRLLLTGTPLQNNLPELWALLNFVLPKVFNSVKSFDEWFNTPFANAGGGDATMQLNEEEQLLIIKRLHKVLRPFLLRRLKKDVESELPDKIEKVIKCAKSALQTKMYAQLSKHKTLFTGNELGGATKKAVQQPQGIRGLQNMLMQLRKICQHPYVFDEVEDAVNPTRATGPDLYRVSGKFELLDRVLPKLKATGHRVLMFFQMTQIMNIMEDYLRYRDHTYLRLDGSTKQDERGTMLHEFNKPDSPYFMFILSTRAGGLGLNLQSADTVIIFDSDFNPHQDLQAQDRAHRIGQKMEVRIFRLVTEKSVEEKILEIAHRKLDMDGKVIQAGRFHDSATNEERDSLLRAMLENAEDEDVEGDSSDLTDEEINALLARSPEEEVQFAEMDQEREKQDQRDWIEAGGSGAHPPRLITEPELPEHFQQAFEDKYNEMEEAKKVVQPDDDTPQPRRRRAAQQVRYNDDLTESQFLAALENEQDPAEVAAAKRERRERRQAQAHKSVNPTPEPGVGDEEEEAAETDGAASEASEAEPELEPEPEPESEPESEPEPEPELEPPRTSRRTVGKRKRSLAADLGEVDNSDAAINTDTPARTKRNKTEPSSTERQLISQVLKRCYDALLESTDEDGRDRAALFIDLPSAKLYPDYRTIIKHPICLRQIKRRVDGCTYRDLASATKDVEQMCTNAQAYNEEGSWVWDDAAVLRQAWQDALTSCLADPAYASLATSAAGTGVASSSAADSTDGVATPETNGTKVRLSLGTKKLALSVQKDDV